MATAAALKLLTSALPDITNLHSLSEADQLISMFISDRDLFGMQLDTNFTVFQPLYGYADEWPAADFAAHYQFHAEEDTRLFNKHTTQHPGVLLAHGNTKLLNQLNNYMPLKWHPNTQCLTCNTADSADPAARVAVTFLVLRPIQQHGALELLRGKALRRN